MFDCWQSLTRPVRWQRPPFSYLYATLFMVLLPAHSGDKLTGSHVLRGLLFPIQRQHWCCAALDVRRVCIVYTYVVGGCQIFCLEIAKCSPRYLDLQHSAKMLAPRGLAGCHQSVGQSRRYLAPVSANAVAQRIAVVGQHRRRKPSTPLILITVAGLVSRPRSQKIKSAAN